MKKKFVRCFAVMLCIGLLTSCGLPAPSALPATSSGADLGGALEGEITFWHSFVNGPRLESIQNLSLIHI